MVDKDESSYGGVEEATTPVVPSQASDDGGEDEANQQDQGQVELVLELDDGVSSQVGNVGNTRLPSRLDNHPTDVRPEETIVGTVWVQVGVGVSVMSTVSSSPPVDRSFNSTSAHQGEEVLEWSRGCV